MSAFPVVSLPARQLFEVADPCGVRIACTAGCLWLTLDHDPRDVILRPGDTFEADEPRRLLLYAFEPSAFALVPAGQGTVPARLARNTPDCGRSPAVWTTTRTAGAG